MKEYHKIQTVFHRDPITGNKRLIEGQYSLPEFELLKDIDWVWTEKIDGTNIRIIFDGVTVRYGGKTDNADINTKLLIYLQETFSLDRMKTAFVDASPECIVTLYGEGYGAKIAKGGNYMPDRTEFILFDCNIDAWWLKRENCEDIATKLNIKIVPIIRIGKLLDAVEFVRQGFKSTIADNKDYIAEGLIMKPIVDLFNRRGDRIITKIKYKDFKRD